MRVNNLIVNDRPALPKKKRHEIRAQVHLLNQQHSGGEVPNLKFVRSTQGKTIMLRSFHLENHNRILGE